MRLLPFGLLTCVLLIGCAAPTRRPVPQAQINDVSPAGLQGWRFVREDGASMEDPHAAARIESIRNQMKASGLDREPINVLAISGGGDNGAYGAGLLNGWTTMGDRPTFNVVTGISTGALTAPFAFLGPEYDDRMELCYTTYRTDDLVDERSLLGGLTSDAMTDPTGLRALIEAQFDEEAYRQMGREHLRGRRLYIGTTNLDRMEPTYWCVSAISALDLPDGRRLACDIMLASASIPGVFPPVMIDVVDSDGEIYDEMHVDGGVSTQVFTFPVALRIGETTILDDADRISQVDSKISPPTIWVVRNAPLTMRYKQIERSLSAIAGRAISGLIKSNGIGDLYRIWLTATRDGFRFRLASIPFDFDEQPTEFFDPIFMRKLYDRGYDDALSNDAWRDHPPEIGPRDEEALFAELRDRRKSDR